jgi:hypothetical protein
MREVIVLYFGDYDPTGSRMVQNIQREVEGAHATFERVAITEEQIAQYNLEHLKTEISDEVKKKLEDDPNAESFKRANNGELFQIELDALNALAPDDFIELLENTVDNHFDQSIYDKVLKERKYSARIIRGHVWKYIKDFDKLSQGFKARKRKEKKEQEQQSEDEV